MLLSYDQLKRFLDQLPNHILVVLDEAYRDYIQSEDENATLVFLTDYPNVIITRTFSKMYGMAGLRLTG